MKLKQENYVELKGSLGYKVSSRPASAKNEMLRDKREEQEVLHILLSFFLVRPFTRK